MEKEQQLKLDIDSLCVYKGLFYEKIGDKFRILVEKIVGGEYISESIRAYNDFVCALFSISSKLSFKEAMVSEMLLTNNPFNESIKSNEAIPEFIVNGINNELDFLGRIVEIDSKQVKEILISKYAPNKELINRINSLMDFGLLDEEYSPKNLTDFEKIKAKFINESNWNEKGEYILEFHRRNGAGRASAYSAFVWERFINEEEGHLREILEPDPIRLKDLIGYESQKEEIIKNTKNFLAGIPSNNLLLYGSRGTGKSSTVKAILNEFYTEGLRLIEVDKEQLNDFTRIIRLLKHKKQKFIIFVDDLVFSDNEASYSALKTILEGRIENRPDNILIYATTNRRHLVQEKFSDREDEVHTMDNKEEKLSLADRFGITISFYAPDQKEYLSIVEGIAEERGIEIEKDYLYSEALKWEKWHNGRSPRSARQFIDWLEGELKNKKK